MNRNDEYRNITKNALKENDSIPYFYLPDINGDFYSSNRFKGKIIYINLTYLFRFKNCLYLRVKFTPTIFKLK